VAPVISLLDTTVWLDGARPANTMSWAVNEMAVDEMAVDEMAVVELTLHL